MNFPATSLTCAGCGGSQVYDPSLGTLSCEFCNTQTEIPLPTQAISAHDYRTTLYTLNDMQKEATATPQKSTQCKKCAASFELPQKDFALRCPYCNTPVMIECIQEITPDAIIPFYINHKDAKERFRIWVGSRWFAPNAFKKYLGESKALIGYYFPYWDYDTQTVTQYRGERGDTYYVSVEKNIIVNGKRQLQTVQEARIAWSYASGTVYAGFDDITVGASHTIKRDRLDAIAPWHTDDLRPFDLKYITGFKAQEYTVELQEGFEIAKDIIAPTIKQKIRADIGGDHQRIHSAQTQYNNIGYKNLLCPVWIASFEWNKKIYQYAINAQTGKIVGERPYSYIKIAFAVIGAMCVVGIIMYFGQGK